jgi:hypothetical protein
MSFGWKSTAAEEEDESDDDQKPQTTNRSSTLFFLDASPKMLITTKNCKTSPFIASLKSISWFMQRKIEEGGDYVSVAFYNCVKTSNQLEHGY